MGLQSQSWSYKAYDVIAKVSSSCIDTSAFSMALRVCVALNGMEEAFLINGGRYKANVTCCCCNSSFLNIF